MIVKPLEECDETLFLSMCEAFYSSGATSRGYDCDIAEKTFRYLMCKHENLWGYFLQDKQDGSPIGYALLTSYWCNEDGGKIIILDELYISAEYRHRGYGRLFLEWVEERFRGDAVSITLEVLTTNSNAKSLYQKQGYADDGFEIMTKKL